MAVMSRTIKAEVAGTDELARFWDQYFPETPVCSHPECEGIAREVDSFFPYLDDLNRCDSHPLEPNEPLRRSARGCIQSGLHSIHGIGAKASGLSLAMKYGMRLYR